MSTQVAQPQSIQVPNYSGVNIQIINPQVNAPGAVPTIQNTNAPVYNPPCYPGSYYTEKIGGNPPPPVTQQPAPVATATPPAPATPSETEKKKTEKRDIVKLTNEYLQNVENYLNSQDAQVRLMGAKEVLARLQEDDSRKDDKALNALVNKMLQDPSSPVRFIALAALDSRTATGDDTSVQILKNMQTSNTGYGQDAAQASSILLKMSGQTIQKEFEVKDKPPKKEVEKKEK